MGYKSKLSQKTRNIYFAPWISSRAGFKRLGYPLVNKSKKRKIVYITSAYHCRVSVDRINGPKQLDSIQHVNLVKIEARKLHFPNALLFIRKVGGYNVTELHPADQANDNERIL